MKFESRVSHGEYNSVYHRPCQRVNLIILEYCANLSLYAMHPHTQNNNVSECDFILELYCIMLFMCMQILGLIFHDQTIITYVIAWSKNLVQIAKSFTLFIES